MKIYTRDGDEGDTVRAGGGRVRKSDPLVEAVGTLDELNACLGLCLARVSPDSAEVAAALQPTQGELLALGAELAAVGTEAVVPAGPGADAVARMEHTIDEISARLPALDCFLLPGGGELASRLHLARTVCRRAERRTVAAADAGAELPAAALRYLNRLGDLLFVLARRACADAGAPKAPWHGRDR